MRAKSKHMKLDYFILGYAKFWLYKHLLFKGLFDNSLMLEKREPIVMTVSQGIKMGVYDIGIRVVDQRG
jgi:hypothetical protein